MIVGFRMTSCLCQNDFACRANKFNTGDENGPGSLGIARALRTFPMLWV
jgi:hypothetical protein